MNYERVIEKINSKIEDKLKKSPFIIPWSYEEAFKDGVKFVTDIMVEEELQALIERVSETEEGREKIFEILQESKRRIQSSQNQTKD